MSSISSHVLDTSCGRPAVGIHIRLEQASDTGWRSLGEGDTNEDGRVSDLGAATVGTGTYRLTFETGAYFARREVVAFYPRVRIEFEINAPDEHYHVPLLLNPFGYSTYRGS